MEEVIKFLSSVKLDNYSKEFEINGYGDLFILTITEVQINNMLKTVGMYEKPGHKFFFCSFKIQIG